MTEQIETLRSESRVRTPRAVIKPAAGIAWLAAARVLA